MRLGVLGGTFDPPHIAHLIFAEQAREQLGLDRVLFIPAGDPWRKAGRDITPAASRLEMVRLAVADNPAFEADDCEVSRAGPTYTVDTLRSLKQRLHAQDEIFFLVGQDALADIPFWQDPSGIAELAMIVVAPRQGVEDPPELPFQTDRLAYVVMPFLDISSTALRERARRGQSLRYFVPPAVEAYIRENKVYIQKTDSKFG
jgi:nicotinate-nucleotide adenylyltransferase